ncbi:PilT protein domain protein (fragment) [Kamptonema sp. PCC 6506]
MVLELAVKARCDSIVTYNNRDFVEIDRFGLKTVKPIEFLQSIGVLL